MQKNQNLVPTIIKDKNGKVTTVHRRADKQPLSASSTIPAPVASQPTADTHAKIDRIYQTIITKYNLDLTDEDDREDSKTIIQRLFNRSEEVINSLYDSLGSLHGTLVLDAVSSGAANDHHVLETITFESSLRQDAPFIPILNGLREYEGIFPVMTDYSKSTGKIREQAAALLSFTSALGAEYPSMRQKSELPDHIILQEIFGKSGRRTVKLSDENMIRYLLDNTEHAERIAEIVLERETTDTALITSILGNTAPSMSNGVL